MNTPLSERDCVPCRGGVPPLDLDAVERLLGELNGGAGGWCHEAAHHLHKTWEFDDFASGLVFVNDVGEEAERQGHHPDVHLAWGRVKIEIWTHKIDGLTESDFVLAARIDDLAGVDRRTP